MTAKRPVVVEQDACCATVLGAPLGEADAAER